jgi:hypothetical protein
MKRTYRQGDLLFVETPEMPPDAGEVLADQLVLAEGELTGHAHRVSLHRGLRGWHDGNRYWLEVAHSACVAHEEHAPVELPPGIFEVRQQRIYLYGALPASD